VFICQTEVCYSHHMNVLGLGLELGLAVGLGWTFHAAVFINYHFTKFWIVLQQYLSP